MAPEETRWNGSCDRPFVVQTLGFIRKGELDLVDIARRTVSQHSSNESMHEFAERTMVERQWLGVAVRLAPMKCVLPDKTERIAKKAMEGCRRLHFGESVENQGMVCANEPVMGSVAVAVLPGAPAGAAGANLLLLARICRPRIEAIALAECMPWDGAPTYNSLLIAAP